MNDTLFMKLAIDEAWKYQGLTYPNPAVGAVVVGSHGEILSIAAHQKAGEPHAEVLALRDAYTKLTGDVKITSFKSSHDIHDYLHVNHNNCFSECTIYTTLEPCTHIGKTPSCATLLQKLSFKRVVIGSLDTHKIASGGKSFFKNVESGVCQEACDALLAPFNAWQNNNFIFFKWAQRLDGTVDGGTVSSLQSRTDVHALRDRCDLLVVGGNTVREDRPTLDSRLVNGKAPDILIYSNSSEFDKTIPLFNVPKRKVHIESDFSMLKEYKNIMIEGGPSMFSATKGLVNYYLSFIAPSSGGTIPFTNEKIEFKYLHVEPSGNDLKIWLEEKQLNE
ncbi:MAG: bifunctional diaminohydroxyphosphoribosylaminopyrimidine deaminase/5-amino-6-(5-phosphoribosylamino)uracil reductase RibD [Campylobacterota bacterium]|nr:bifunctional diaminohydroxyphosphoribosylaminopyrimidine deaminase/5-amino-6-(5-phosphoribosylamino)uracil reductase RibD [Campylobacterota bacterium]